LRFPHVRGVAGVRDWITTWSHALVRRRRGRKRRGMVGVLRVVGVGVPRRAIHGNHPSPPYSRHAWHVVTVVAAAAAAVAAAAAARAHGHAWSASSLRRRGV